MKTSLEKRIEAERKKLKALDGPQRFRYILDYYGLWIAGGIIAVILLVYLIFHMFFTVKDFQLYGIFANTTADAGTVSVLKQDYAAWRSGLPASEGSDKMEFRSGSFFDPSKTNGTNNSYFQAYVALTEAGTLDFVTMGREALEALGSSGRLLDLSDERIGGLADDWKERLVYSLPYDETYSKEPVPVGIDLSDSRLVTEYHIYDGDCVLGISAYSSHTDEVLKFLTFLSEETGGG